MPSVSIKIDYAASLRNLRGIKEPDPSHPAILAEIAGADGISCHLREDRLHIRDRDIYILKEVSKTKFNLQIAPLDDLIERALEVKPSLVTLMPFETEFAYTEKGIDFTTNQDQYTAAAETLQSDGISICCFVDPDSDAVKGVARLKCEAVELNAAYYAGAKAVEESQAELDRLDQMAQLASKLGMAVRCGNSLNYRNIIPLIELDMISEFTIGHAVISRGLMVGMDRAVREIVDIIRRPVADH